MRSGLLTAGLVAWAAVLAVAPAESADRQPAGDVRVERSNGLDYGVSVIGLVPCGPKDSDFLFCLVMSNRAAAAGMSLEPGLPAGWSTNLSLRLQVDKDGRRTLSDPIGWRRRFVRNVAKEVLEAPGGFVLKETAKGASLTARDGRRWEFDRNGYVVSRTEPDGTAIVVRRDAKTGRMLGITISRPAGYDGQPAPPEGRLFPERPVTGFTTWVPPSGRQIYYLGSSSNRWVPAIPGLPLVEKLVIQRDAAGRWISMHDEYGRHWTFAYDNDRLTRITGSGLNPEVPAEVRAEYVSDGTLFKIVVKNFVGYLWTDRPATASRPAAPDGPPSASQVPAPPSPPMYGRPSCPPGYRECASNLYDWIGRTGVPPNFLAWTDGSVEYRGSLRSHLEWKVLRPILSCLPGEGVSQTYSFERSQTVSFDWGMGLNDALSWEAGIEETITVGAEAQLDSACCDWTEDCQRYQSCWLPVYHDVYPHTLLYWYRLPGGEWSSPQVMKRTWLGSSIGRLRCCDECCTVDAP